MRQTASKTTLTLCQLLEERDTCKCKSDELMNTTQTLWYLRSISQKNTWASLEICHQPISVVIMHKHKIMPEFLQIIRRFQDKACDFEEGFRGNS